MKCCPAEEMKLPHFLSGENNLTGICGQDERVFLVIVGGKVDHRILQTAHARAMTAAMCGTVKQQIRKVIPISR